MEIDDYLPFFWNIPFEEVDDYFTCGRDAPLNEIVLLDHEKHVLFDSYIVEFVHDATENYFERGKYGSRNFHVTKTPLSSLKVLKVLLFFPSYAWYFVLHWFIFLQDPYA